jgi:hypothetical protein
LIRAETGSLKRLARAIPMASNLALAASCTSSLYISLYLESKQISI